MHLQSLLLLSRINPELCLYLNGSPLEPWNLEPLCCERPRVWDGGSFLRNPPLTRNGTTQKGVVTILIPLLGG